MHSSAIEHRVFLSAHQTRGLQRAGIDNDCATTQEALRLAVDRLIEPQETGDDFGAGLPGPSDLL